MWHALIVAIALFAGVIGNEVAYAHSGGTNSLGCHTVSKTGEYHCHRSKRKSSASYPTYDIRSTVPPDLPGAPE